jgi:energy-coupling factor transporter ATP-binding protein EcfA2
MSKYPQGSTWRRWDLHVHTPASIVQDYGGDTPSAWDAFIARLKALPKDIAVLAINDYLFVDGYEKLLARRSELPQIAEIFPAIEFRLNTFSGTASNNRRHNFHVLFDPSVSPATIREQLLNCMSTGYLLENKEAWNRTPTVGSLTELGKMMKKTAPAGNSIHAKSDLQVGFESITYKRDDILKHLEKDCFVGKFLIAIGYSEWDQARWDQSAAEKRDLINRAHFSLVSNDDVAKIAEHVQELESQKLNSLILHSSDAHDIARLGGTKLWIKADPTFAGLKQVMNERERVFLGDQPPRFKQPHQVIERIAISNSNGWFETQCQLDLNEGLVAVIGGRGSGKSALTEMLACAVGAADESDDSFVRKAAKHPSSIDGATVTLTWADGSQTTGTAGDVFAEDSGLIKYLPQKAVEALCAPTNSGPLVAQIENVIFQALDDTTRMGASEFAELKTNLLRSYEIEKDDVRARLGGLNAEFQKLSEGVALIPAKKKDLEGKKKELARLQAELPKLPPTDQKGQDELAGLIALKRVLEDQVVLLKKQQERIVELQARVRVFQASFETFYREITEGARSVGISQLAAFTQPFDAALILGAMNARSAELDALILQLRTGTKSQIARSLQVDTSAWSFENLDALNALVLRRTSETKAFETQKVKFQLQKAKIDQAEKTIVALESEIKQLETVTRVRLSAVRELRFATYGEHFALLAREQAEVSRLYEPLQETLSKGSDTDRRLRFEAQLFYDVHAHLEQGLEILDRTKKGNFREILALHGALERMWQAFKRSGFSADGLKAALRAIWLEFTEIDVDGTSTPIEVVSQLREGQTLQGFFDWLLDLRHFQVRSGLTFDDTDLKLLSPGQKGIVLLMLYLGMDQADTRPLVIDQPEDNLDNLSVYRDLIRLFRDRKRYRQIIIVTHNPNLVVNTDAEQVVIATYDGKGAPRISYSAGSLENQAEHIPDTPVSELEDGIIERVCDVLEGGPHAFSRRSRVYTLSPKIEGGR